MQFVVEIELRESNKSLKKKILTNDLKHWFRNYFLETFDKRIYIYIKFLTTFYIPYEGNFKECYKVICLRTTF